MLHLARRVASTPVLVVRTYRTVGLHRSHPLSGLLAELTREDLFQRLALARLSREETAALIESIDGTMPPGAAVDAIYGQTAGNPFFTIHQTLYKELTLPRRQRLHQQAAAIEQGTAAEAEKALLYSESW